MSIELKVLEKAIAAKDFNLLARRLAEKARELGCDQQNPRGPGWIAGEGQR